MYKLLLLFVAISFYGQTSAQLSNDVNQYMLYQPEINFSSTASYEGVSGLLYYRNQWVGFTGAPENMGFNVAYPINSISSSVGIRVNRDKLGVQTNDVISVGYAYRLKLNVKSYLSFSLTPQIRFFQGQRSQLIANDLQDPVGLNDYVGVISPNFGFGSYYFRDNFYAGVTIPGLLVNDVNSAVQQASTSFDLSAINYMIHSGYEWGLGTNALNLSFLLKSSPGASLHLEINTGLQMWDKKVGIGVSYRSTNELVGMLNFKVLDYVRLGYAYQHAFSNLSSYQSGSHEVMAVLEMRNKKSLIDLNVPRF